MLRLGDSAAGDENRRRPASEMLADRTIHCDSDRVVGGRLAERPKVTQADDRELLHTATAGLVLRDGARRPRQTAIGMSTQQTVPDFLAMLNEALRETMQTDLVLTRITMSKAVGGGRPAGEDIHFKSPPTSDQAEIAVGINAFTLLLRHWELQTVELNLDREGETPVLVRIGCSQVPLRTLYEMLHSAATPLRVIITNAECEANFLCYGPLPKGWMAREALKAVARTALKDTLKRSAGPM